MTGRQDLPAGAFSAWLRQARVAHLTDTAVDVPCGDCAACCTSSYFIHVRPDEAEALRRIPGELLVAAPGSPPGHLVLGYDVHGRCPMLREGRCSIYRHRPLTCRTCDCRVFAAAGIEADRSLITRRAGRWAFSYPTRGDRDEQAAVRDAARFLQSHAACFVDGSQADNPAHVAVLAVKVCDVFRERGDERGGARRGAAGRDTPDDETVRAVIAAGEAFEATRCGRGRECRGGGNVPGRGQPR